MVNQHQQQRHSNGNIVSHGNEDFFNRSGRSINTTTTTALSTVTNQSASATAAAARGIRAILQAMNQHTYNVRLQEKCCQGIATILITLVKLQLQQRRDELEFDDSLSSPFSSMRHRWSIFRRSRRSISKSSNNNNNNNNNRRWSGTIDSINGSGSFDDQHQRTSISSFMSTGSNRKTSKTVTSATTSNRKVGDDPSWRRSSAGSTFASSRQEHD